MTGELALERVTDIFRALSNPLRVEIVRELAQGERAVHELVERLVARRRAGREVTYHLVDHHVAHIVEDAVLHADEVA